MNACIGSWLLGMPLGASAQGGMLGMAVGIFTVLAATTFGSALLYAISGFGFAVLAAPLFLLFLDPARAIQLVIIISTVLSIIVLCGMLPAIAPWLLRRLALGGRDRVNHARLDERATMIRFYHHPTPNPAKIALFLGESGLLPRLSDNETSYRIAR